MIFLFKTDGSTIDGVLKSVKHASNSLPKDIRPGDIILIALTKASVLDDKPLVRWFMEYVKSYEDTKKESYTIWKRGWRYIIQGKNIKSIREPFNMKDLKGSKNYNTVQTFCRLDPMDEELVLNWIQEEQNDANYEYDEFSRKLEEIKGETYQEIIAECDAELKGNPRFRTCIRREINRPTKLRKAILERDKYLCKICKCEGFKKKTGGRYAEAHHMFELNKNAPDTLQSWNVITVCPTCHRKMHYADVQSEFLNPGWKIAMEGKEIIIK